MMLRPRDDWDQTVLESDVDIVPKPIELSWTRDSFGNHVATARFRDRASELRFASTMRLDHVLALFHAADIDDFAQVYPFVCLPEGGAFVAPLAPHPRIKCWAARFLREDRSAHTYSLLVEMTQTIRRTFRHVGRHEKGIQEPVETLTLASGSCRDLAVLMIEALRSLGIAARFVSGYLHLVNDDQVAGGNTHAWVQAYIPGPGWVDFDPSSGMVGNQNLVRVAVAHNPSEAIPLHGTWIGSTSDHLAMNVSVRVSATAL
jgi:transglutaminase-like putative cysteine protease